VVGPGDLVAHNQGVGGGVQLGVELGEEGDVILLPPGGQRVSGLDDALAQALLAPARQGHHNGLELQGPLLQNSTFNAGRSAQDYTVNMPRGSGGRAKQLPGPLADSLGVVVASSLGNSAESWGGLPSSSGFAKEVANSRAQQRGSGAADRGKERVFAVDDDVPNSLVVLREQLLQELHVEALVAKVDVLANGKRGRHDEAVVLLAPGENREAVWKPVLT